MSDALFTWIKYPFVLGSDVAGTVVAVGPSGSGNGSGNPNGNDKARNGNGSGSGAARFHVGDRVVGHAVGMDPRSAHASEGAYQEFVVLRAHMASPIPDSLSFERACVLPLGLSTAACGLFMTDYLALRHPRADPRPETLLVWGASTSVGCNAVQLAAAAGYEVFATASPKNFAYVERLGAARVFDYNAPTVVADLTVALSDKTCAGALAMGNGSTEACIAVVGACARGRRFVARPSVNTPAELPSGMLGMLGMGLGMARQTAVNGLRARLKGVSTKFIFGGDLVENEVSTAVYEAFLPAALANGTFVPAPEPEVVGDGLESVQEALDRHMKGGVSAKKLVVTL